MYVRNACFFVHPVVKRVTGISLLHHCRSTAADCLGRSTTQQQEPRGLWDNPLNDMTLTGRTMALPPLRLPCYWCLFSQPPPFPEQIWGFLHMEIKTNFRSSELLKKVTELPAKGVTVSASCAAHCHSLMPNASIQQRDNYLKSLWAFTKCVWSVNRITYETVGKQKGRVLRPRCLWQRKQHFQIQEYC